MFGDQEEAGVVAQRQQRRRKGDLATKRRRCGVEVVVEVAMDLYSWVEAEGGLVCLQDQWGSLV